MGRLPPLAIGRRRPIWPFDDYFSNDRSGLWSSQSNPSETFSADEASTRPLAMLLDH
jgi:hypothetical protein